ncbi:MAG: ATP-binding protein [Flavobacteriales bacterium]|nr:ATP-binding protein [Flavobacteriales bacterium]|tara:strand:+ start:35635 stop:36774 length:1140 start_codon:yes stop_codon:yes gene_type:complete
MNIYRKKQWWKVFLLIGAIIIAFASLTYTNSLVKRLAKEESKKVQLVAEATKRLISESGDITFYHDIIIGNSTVPVILVDEGGNVITWRNLDSIKVLDNPGYLSSRLMEMKSKAKPIEIPVFDGEKQYIYFEHSILIDMLAYYPYMQLSVIGLFVVISYFAFSSSRNAEQNQVWVGMSKETAHQLGTPLSSLLGWVEYLKSTKVDSSIVEEISKDVSRLETVTDRFSKIGSDPKFENVSVKATMDNVIDYLRLRISDKIKIEIEGDEEYYLNLCVPLFEWVIENLTKNAVDAMGGNGDFLIRIKKIDQKLMIDFSDTGKGIPKNDFKKIFKPGFTSKKRGWGLGLSLVRRIIEDHHYGKIYVKSSEIGKGTVFRIEMPI